MIRNKKIFIIGGAGSLGRCLTKRFLSNWNDVTIYSRDEAKHHYMRQDFLSTPNSHKLNFVIGDIRDKNKIKQVLDNIDPEIIINAAAMKQVPSCEFFPEE